MTRLVSDEIKLLIILRSIKVNNFFSKSALFAAGLFLATSANAAIVNEYWIDQANGIGAYDLVNDTNVDIYGFAVGNDTAVDAYDNSGNFWEALVIDQVAWDAGYSIEIGIDTQTIGLFSDLFAGYNQAVIYASNNSFEPNPVVAGATASGFEFYTMFLSSPFVTFDQNFNMIDQGMATHVSAVPVPAAAWLFISGLIGLVGVSRRKA
jgi:hypothetical protein